MLDTEWCNNAMLSASFVTGHIKRGFCKGNKDVLKKEIAYRTTKVVTRDADK